MDRGANRTANVRGVVSVGRRQRARQRPPAAERVTAKSVDSPGRLRPSRSDPHISRAALSSPKQSALLGGGGNHAAKVDRAVERGGGGRRGVSSVGSGATARWERQGSGAS